MAELQRIMSVEDDEDIRVLVNLALEMVGGFELESCASGQEALQRITAFEPDLLLLDSVMPEMDGAQTLAAIRDLPGMANVPAVFMTAKTQDSDRQAFLSLGALEVLPKPFDPMTLSDEVRKIWDQHQGVSLEAAHD